MSDTYSNLVNNGLGKQVAGRLGLPRPAALRRFRAGEPLVPGPVVVATVGGGALGPALTDALSGLGVQVSSADAAGEEKLGGIVVDVTGATQLGDLESLREVLRPAVKSLRGSGRLLILGATPAQAVTVEQAATQQALEGIVRSLGKELRAGATANLLWVDDEARDDVRAVLGPVRFFLSGRSAYVSGQPLRVRGADLSAVDAPADLERPFAGKVVVVTGAARGIGAEIARVYARGGADVIAVDVPAAGEALAAVANELGATALQLDITTADAGERIAAAAARVGDKLDVIVHNAGITRDKLFVNTDADRWGSVLDVNLGSQLRINAVLLDAERPGGLRDGGSIVSVASISGIGGNRGQSNYAASKAGVIGEVRRLAEELVDRRITVNAVAPGFIETEMTNKIPFATREVGRRLNSMLQGGKPVDVGEAIAFLSEPTSAAVTGQVLRVCGQSQLGA